jgi:hypothetical protein
MARYVLIFAGALVAITAASLIVGIATSWNPTGFINVIQLLFASVLTGMIFVQKNSRLPTAHERRLLTWCSFGIALVFPLIVVGGFLSYLAYRFGLADLRQGLSEQIPSLPFLGWVFVVVLTLAVVYGTLWVGYGFFTNRFGQKVLAARGF